MLTTRNPIILGDPMLQVFYRLLLLSGQVVQIVLWHLDSGCSKHMTGNRSQLMNFVSKFLRIVRFGNDHIAKIMRKCSKQEYDDFPNGRQNGFLKWQAQRRGVVDPTLFTQKAENDLLLVQIYVYDIIFASTNTALCNEFTNLMTTKFKMSMMGQMSFFLGLQISQSPRGIFLNQSKYASEIIKKYGLLTSDSVDTPMVEKNKLDEDLQGTPVDATLYCGMIGSLMYLTSNRPDLIYAVCLCAWYQTKPTEKHLNAVKQIFRYLKGTINMGLWYSKDTNYGFQFNKIPLYCDNKSAIALCCKKIQHSRAKHIDVCYHFIKEQVEKEIVELYFVRMKYQLANIFTNPLPRERFNFLIEKLDMRSMSPKTLKRLTEEEDE
nr:hypothetical protein [Tanacetum cinerariifolium]